MPQVSFRKPNFKLLSDENKTIADMHYHTKYSADSIASPRLVMKKAKKLGIAVAITDHNTIEGAREMWKYRRDIHIIPGIEITEVTGIHTLAYFYDFGELEEFYNRAIKPRLYKMPFFISKNLSYLLEVFKDYNCVNGLAHPFSPGPANINNVKWNRVMLNSIDLIEGINAFNMKARNLMAIDFANKLNKGITAGSDGHSIGELGGAVTIAEGDSNEELLRALVKGESRIIGKENHILKKAMLLFGKETTAIRKNIKSKNQLNMMRSMFHLNKESISAMLGNRNGKISKIINKKKNI